MAQIAIQKSNDLQSLPQRVLEQVQTTIESIRQRAFDLFQHRNGANGSEMEDWVQAERDLIWSPACELLDEENEFKATVALPGFDAKDVQVSATPGELVIQAASTHTHEGKNGNVRFCEFSDKQIFRRLELPTLIDVDKVSATLKDGILKITAPKTAPQLKSAAA